MYETYKVSYVSEVQDGKVKFFKEYTDPVTWKVMKMEPTTEKAYNLFLEKRYHKETTNKMNESLMAMMCDLSNTGNLDFVALYGAFVKQHRQLQGDVVNTLVCMLEMCADDTYRTDARNEFVKLVGKHLKDKF